MRSIIIAIALLLALAGCGGDSIPADDVAFDAGMGMGGVFEVRLRDGTRCAVMTMPYKGGIDCEWENQ